MSCFRSAFGARVCDPQQLRWSEWSRTALSGLAKLALLRLTEPRSAAGSRHWKPVSILNNLHL